jgi:3-phenylpropionate/trans-cinnamate dioxygenase ferredoxin reductase component
MEHYKYLIIGGGMTADAAALGIREMDTNGSIGLIGSESDPPYNRPPLSKKLWSGKPFDSIWRATREKGVELHLGRTVRSLNPHTKVATDDKGSAYAFEKLLLATGGTPRRLSFGGEEIIYFRSAQDYRRLRALSEEKEHFAVIGGGFIGSEVAAALAMNGKQVTMLLPQEGIGWRLFPPRLSHFITDYYRQKGVRVLSEYRVEGMRTTGGQSFLKTSGVRNDEGPEIVADAVIAGVGILPNVELAEQAGLEVGKGIVVDEHLRASNPDIYAAGDVAAFYNPALGERIRVEHEDNALTMGRAAGRNMAGAEEHYDHLPYFYSDLFDLGYEAIGELDPQLELVEDWQEPFRKGVVYYLRQGRVRGVLLWNVWDQVPNARQIIAEPGPFRAEDLRGGLPS